MKKLTRAKKLKRVSGLRPVGVFSVGTRVRLKVTVHTRLGAHKPGEEGCMLSQANGTGNFFPDRGGVVAALPWDKVESLDAPRTASVRRPIAPFERARKVRKLRKA